MFFVFQLVLVIDYGVNSKISKNIFPGSFEINFFSLFNPNLCSELGSCIKF